VVRVVEGVLKADVTSALDPRHIPTVGVQLGNPWAALPQLKALGARKVIVAFDKDEPGRQATEKFCEQLSRAGYDYGVEVWDPRDKGPDDALHAGQRLRTIWSGSPPLILLPNSPASTPSAEGAQAGRVALRDETAPQPPSANAANECEQGHSQQNESSNHDGQSTSGDGNATANSANASPGGGGDWPDPTPIDGLAETACFPLNVFPPAVAEYVGNVADSIGCPVDFPAANILAAASVAAGSRWQVPIRGVGTQKAILFLAVVGAPGTAKTPAAMEVLSPVIAVNNEWHDAWEKDTDEEDDRPRGIPQECWVDDFTMESLPLTLRQSPEGVLCIKDELTALLLSLNAYKPQNGGDRQILLSLFSGVPMKRARANGQRLRVPSPFASIVGNITTDELPKLLGRDGGSGDGLLSRFLFAYPPYMPPLKYHEHGTISPSLRENWDTAVRWLFQTRPQGAQLEVAGRALDRWAHHFDALVGEDDAWTPGSMIAEAWSKLRAYAARLIIVLHALKLSSSRAGVTTDVSEETVDGAWKLIDYSKAMNRKVYGELGGDLLTKQIRKIIDVIRAWKKLKAKESRGCFTLRDLHEKVKNSIKLKFQKTEALATPIQVLVRTNYLRHRDDLPGNSYEAHPSLLR
jgi:hypothetical protein